MNIMLNGKYKSPMYPPSGERSFDVWDSLKYTLTKWRRIQTFFKITKLHNKIMDDKYWR